MIKGESEESDEAQPDRGEAAPSPARSEDAPDSFQELATFVGKVVSSTVSVQSSWSGPLPSPSDLAAYNEAQPDASERILKMAERQQRVQMWELALSYGLIALGAVGAIWGPRTGTSVLAVGVLPIAAGLAVAVVTAARRFRRRHSSD